MAYQLNNTVATPVCLVEGPDPIPPIPISGSVDATIVAPLGGAGGVGVEERGPALMLLTAIANATAVLAACVNTGRVLVTELNSAAIKTATEAVAACVSAGRLLTDEINSGAIKTAVETVAACVSANKLAISGSVDVNGPSSCFTQAQKTDLSNVTPFQLPSHPGLKVGIRLSNQETTAANVIYIGDVNVSATQYLVVVFPGQTSDWLPCSDSNAYYALAAVNNSDFTFGGC